jgi:hypothetical protein
MVPSDLRKDYRPSETEVVVAGKTPFFIVTAVKTSNLTKHHFVG